MPVRNLLEYIGNTPLIKPTHWLAALGLKADIYAKCEGLNPAGSVKDRAALAMILSGEKSGQILPHTTIIEATSGNTGIGLALVCAQRGYQLILTMPESMSIERRSLLSAMGARLVLTPAEKGMQGAVDEAEKIAASLPAAYIASQFTNAANAAAHYHHTAPEIWQALGGKIDILIATIGSGGTISGCGRYFKDRSEQIKIIGVEPTESPLLSQGIAAAHPIQGIGANFVPELLDRSVIDEIVTASGDESVAMAQLFGKKEGCLVGISSGAALAAAAAIARRANCQDKTMAVILPDRGERYLSTPLFDRED